MALHTRDLLHSPPRGMVGRESGTTLVLLESVYNNSVSDSVIACTVGEIIIVHGGVSVAESEWVE